MNNKTDALLRENAGGYRSGFLLPEWPLFVYIGSETGARQLLRLPESGRFQPSRRFHPYNCPLFDR